MLSFMLTVFCAAGIPAAIAGDNVAPVNDPATPWQLELTRLVGESRDLADQIAEVKVRSTLAQLGSKGIGDLFTRWPPSVPLEDAWRALSRYDVLWSIERIPRDPRMAPIWERLGRERPEILRLLYQSAYTTREPGPPNMYDVAWIEANHPEWFLVATPDGDPLDPDDRLRWSKDPANHHYNRWRLDVTDPAFQQYAAGVILTRVSGRQDGLEAIPFSGLAADNVSIGSTATAWLDGQYPAWKYAGRPDEWNRGFLTFLEVIREQLNAHGFVLVVNSSMDHGSTEPGDLAIWPRLYEAADVLLTERAIGKWGVQYTGAQWARAMARHDEILRRGLVDWWCCYPKTAEAFRYEYASWLLVRRPGRSFFYASRTDAGGATVRLPFYDEYDLALGDPQGPRYEPAPGLWVRDYAGGRAIVNATAAPRPFVNGPELTYDWHQRRWVYPGRVLQVPAKTGRILLGRLAYLQWVYKGT
jgi:hypothetical protein